MRSWQYLDKSHKLCFIYFHIETNASCCLLQAMQQRFDLSRCICKKCQIICVVSISMSIKAEHFGIITLKSWRPEFNPRSSPTKDSKMILDGALLNTQHYKVRIKSKVKQSRERSGALPYISVL